MANLNFLVLALAALIPLVLGFIYYHPKVLGKAWMSSAGLTPESIKGFNMGKVFGLTYFLSFLLAMTIQFIVIHQFSIYSILADEPGIRDPESEIGKYLADFMARFGTNFRTFKHGALHGVIVGFFFALPIIAVNGMFERKSFKYIAINTGFWMISLAIMGGIICAFA